MCDVVQKGFDKAKHPPETRAAQVPAPLQTATPLNIQGKMRTAVAVYDGCSCMHAFLEGWCVCVFSGAP